MAVVLTSPFHAAQDWLNANAPEVTDMPPVITWGKYKEQGMTVADLVAQDPPCASVLMVRILPLQA